MLVRAHRAVLVYGPVTGAAVQALTSPRGCGMRVNRLGTNSIKYITTVRRRWSSSDYGGRETGSTVKLNAMRSRMAEGGRQETMDLGSSGSVLAGHDVLAVGEEGKCVITGYDPQGFDINGDTNARGSVVVFPRSYVMWKPTCVDAVSIESLELVTLMNPKVGSDYHVQFGYHFNILMDSFHCVVL